VTVVFILIAFVKYAVYAAPVAAWLDSQLPFSDQLPFPLKDHDESWAAAVMSSMKAVNKINLFMAVARIRIRDLPDISRQAFSRDLVPCA
jgi:hypothetical protein